MASQESGCKTWRCFHCNEEFTDESAATEHFGCSQDRTAACQIDIAEYRRMEREVALYRNEDTELHREIASLHARQFPDARRAEEDGYARGLADARKHPEDVGLYTLAGAVTSLVEGLNLEWVDDCYPDLCVARVSFGCYYVKKEPCDKPHPAKFGKHAAYWPIGDVWYADSIDHGKQLCLADYKFRVRSILTAKNS